jgi:hypothetical protein
MSATIIKKVLIAFFSVIALTSVIFATVSKEKMPLDEALNDPALNANTAYYHMCPPH